MGFPFGVEFGKPCGEAVRRQQPLGSGGVGLGLAAVQGGQALGFLGGAAKVFDGGGMVAQGESGAVGRQFPCSTPCECRESCE